MDEFFKRLKPLAALTIIAVAWLTHFFGSALMSKIETMQSHEILALIVGTGLGGLVAVIGQLLTDPPGAVVPASTHEKALGILQEQLNKQAAKYNIKAHALVYGAWAFILSSC